MVLSSVFSSRKKTVEDTMRDGCTQFAEEIETGEREDKGRKEVFLGSRWCIACVDARL